MDTPELLWRSKTQEDVLLTRASYVAVRDRQPEGINQDATLSCTNHSPKDSKRKEPLGSSGHIAPRGVPAMKANKVDKARSNKACSGRRVHTTTLRPASDGVGLQDPDGVSVCIGGAERQSTSPHGVEAPDRHCNARMPTKLRHSSCKPRYLPRHSQGN